MFLPRFMPCPQCGESVERSALRAHSCNRDRRVDHQLLGLREDITAFETRLQDYLDTESGRFEVWLAARHVRASTDPR
ncbi:MAG TPA: hypothetical protein VNP20_18365 [Nocardioidaceae bacterium]|nr:hypothetical protein [Nocardioidaceae bacterium]